MTPEKSEEQVEREREAVRAMTGAKKAMEDVLARNASLEHALKVARQEITKFKEFVPNGAYTYGGKHRVLDLMDESIVSITKTLGR